MPTCKRCGRVAASAEMRRSPKSGYLCKDKIGCDHDRRVKRQGADPGPRDLQKMFRF